jgi:AraC-like DNA-binding protein
MKLTFPNYSIGHFINQPEKKTDFEIMRFEEMEEPNVDDIHKHTFYEILWTEQGTSKQTIDYAEYEVLPNSLFFISPNQIHQFEQWEHLIGGTILFTEDFLLFNQCSKDRLFELSFLDNFYSNPYIQLSGDNFNEIKHTINLISKEQFRSDKNSSIIQSLLHILLAQIQRCIDSTTKSPITKKYLITYKEFKHQLDLSYKENKTTSFYAEQLSITQHHLNLIAKQITGRTATEFIRERTILEAKRLLTFTDHSINEIAADLNFFDNSYFAKLFRMSTGLSPLAFRKEMSEKYRNR